MTPKEAFKIGFLEKCAEDGLSNEQIMQRIQHAKFLMKVGPLEKTSNFFSGSLKAMLPLMLLAPPVAGVAGGYGLAKLQDQKFDADEARRREELAEYRRALERLRRLRTRQQQAG